MSSEIIRSLPPSGATPGTSPFCEYRFDKVIVCWTGTEEPSASLVNGRLTPFLLNMRYHIFVDGDAPYLNGLVCTRAVSLISSVT